MVILADPETSDRELSGCGENAWDLPSTLQVYNDALSITVTHRALLVALLDLFLPLLSEEIPRHLEERKSGECITMRSLLYENLSEGNRKTV